MAQLGARARWALTMVVGLMLIGAADGARAQPPPCVTVGVAAGGTCASLIPLADRDRAHRAIAAYDKAARGEGFGPRLLEDAEFDLRLALSAVQRYPQEGELLGRLSLRLAEAHRLDLSVYGYASLALQGFGIASGPTPEAIADAERVRALAIAADLDGGYCAKLSLWFVGSADGASAAIRAAAPALVRCNAQFQPKQLPAVVERYLTFLATNETSTKAQDAGFGRLIAGTAAAGDGDLLLRVEHAVAETYDLGGADRPNFDIIGATGIADLELGRRPGLAARCDAPTAAAATGCARLRTFSMLDTADDDTLDAALLLLPSAGELDGDPILARLTARYAERAATLNRTGELKVALYQARQQAGDPAGALLADCAAARVRAADGTRPSALQPDWVLTQLPASWALLNRQARQRFLGCLSKVAPTAHLYVARQSLNAVTTAVDHLLDTGAPDPAGPDIRLGLARALLTAGDFAGAAREAAWLKDHADGVSAADREAGGALWARASGLPPADTAAQLRAARIPVPQELQGPSPVTQADLKATNVASLYQQMVNQLGVEVMVQASGGVDFMAADIADPAAQELDRRAQAFQALTGFRKALIDTEPDPSRTACLASSVAALHMLWSPVDAAANTEVNRLTPEGAAALAFHRFVAPLSHALDRKPERIGVQALADLDFLVSFWASRGNMTRALAALRVHRFLSARMFAPPPGRSCSDLDLAPRYGSLSTDAANALIVGLGPGDGLSEAARLHLLEWLLRRPSPATSSLMQRSSADRALRRDIDAREGALGAAYVGGKAEDVWTISSALSLMNVMLDRTSWAGDPIAAAPEAPLGKGLRANQALVILCDGLWPGSTIADGKGAVQTIVLRNGRLTAHRVAIDIGRWDAEDYLRGFNLDAWREGGEFNAKAAHDLFSWTFGGVRKQLAGATRAYVVGLGSFQKLPLAALVTSLPPSPEIRSGDFSGLHWLVEDVEIVQTLPWLPARSHEGHPGQGLVAFTNPNYGAAGAPNTQAIVDPSVLALGADDDVWSATTCGLAALDRDSPAGRLRAAGAKVLDADEASETRFKQMASDHGFDAYGGLIIYAHGLTLKRRLNLGFTDTTPAIALGASPGCRGGAVGTQVQTGFLTPVEIAAFDLPFDWVVLAGCDTSHNESTRFETIPTLPEGFFGAGARVVIATSAAVPADSTAALVETIQEAKVRGVSIIDAATRALRSVLHDRAHAAWRHPAFWGSWVLMSTSTDQP